MTQKRMIVLASLALAASAPSVVRAASYTVPDHFSTIQKAIDAAAEGDTIHVRPGIHYGNIVVGKAGLTIRSLAGAPATLLDGRRAGPVVTIASSNVTLEGFTVQHGTGNGAVLVRGGSVTISNCAITANGASGFFIDGGSARIAGGSITNNSATPIWAPPYNWGGGIMAISGDVEVDHVVIAGNTAMTGGGMFTAWGSRVTMRASIVSGNTATTGGGVQAEGLTNIYDSIIEGNTASDSGGGLYSKAWILNMGNGTLFQTSTFVSGTTITGNTAPVGAGFTQDSVQGVLRPALTARGVIVWGNSGPPAEISSTGYGSSLDFQASDVEGDSLLAGGNINADPLFLDAASRDYQLSAASPAVNAVPVSVAASTTDLIGISRPQGPAVDMGAYEWTEAIPPVSTATVAGTQGANGFYVSPVTVTFAAEDLSGVVAIHYIVNGAETVASGATATLSLAATGTYGVTWWAVDAYGNAEPQKSLPAIKIDLAPPTVASVSPADRATSVAKTASVVVTFSENVTAGPAYANVVLKRGTSVIATTKTLSGKTLTLKPSTSLSSLTTYTVSVPAGAVVDQAGLANASPTTTTFTTR